VLGRPELYLLAFLVCAVGGDRPSERGLLHLREKRLCDAELDVSLKERQPHFLEGLVGVAVCQHCLTGEEVSGLPEAFGDRLEHEGALTPPRRGLKGNGSSKLQVALTSGRRTPA
jgi:hypothetical protein